MKIKLIQNIIDKIRGKCKSSKIVDNGCNNQINIHNSRKNKSSIIVTVNGNNNSIIIEDLNEKSYGKINISIFGDNNSIVINKNLLVAINLNITIGQKHEFHGKVKKVYCSLGSNIRIEDACITTYNSNNKIVIGDDCMISLKAIFYNTDGHPIYDKETNNLVNYVNDMIIGNNCWIGYNATILKGVKLSDGTIVGWGAVVSKSIDEKFCAIAGNPAKIVKHKLAWSKGGDNNYIENKRL